jgi:hypothetical protein
MFSMGCSFVLVPKQRGTAASGAALILFAAFVVSSIAQLSSPPPKDLFPPRNASDRRSCLQSSVLQYPVWREGALSHLEI